MITSSKKEMSQRTQRQKRKEKTFEDLPPRVVIYDILNYHQIRLDSSLREFDLFGYYKRDRRRSVWYLFQSLLICFTRFGIDEILRNNSTKDDHAVVKIEKLHSLDIQGDFLSSKSVFRSFIETFKRTNMYLLKRLSIDFCGDCIDITGLFSEQIRCPKLMHLEIGIDRKNILKDWKWDVERIKSLQETLVSLTVASFDTEDIRDVGLRILGNDNTFASLKKIHFSSLNFSSKRRVLLPCLEDVYLENCQNLVLIPGSNVSSINLDTVQPGDLWELFLRSKKIKVLILRTYELFNDPNNWLLEESTNPMENLRSLILYHYDVRCEKFEIFLERIRNQITEFKVSWCSGLEKRLLENGFEKLEILTIQSPKLLPQNETKWGFSSHLRKLIITDNSLNSIFFRNNNFSSLEVLNLKYCSYTKSRITSSGTSLNHPLTNLKKLLISSGIGDLFFEEQDFENLEILEMSSIHEPKLTGNGWKRTRFNKLREIKVKNDAIANDVFKLIEFPVLRKLELVNCSEITGEGWLSMPNLLDVNIPGCTGISKEKILERKNCIN